MMAQLNPLAQVVCWLGVGGTLWIFLGYPLLMQMLRRFCANHPSPVELQPCSVLIVAYNEARHLEAKINSLLANDAASYISEIVVGSDGSNDATAEVVAGLDDARVRLVEFPERRGKPAVLNELIPACQSEIVVLTDARQLLEADAISRLLAGMGEGVGVVSGELMFRRVEDDSAAAEGMDVYWRYEKWIRKAESAVGSVPGATGALYAIRRAQFRPIPESSVLDDVAIPLMIMRQGWRCRYAEQAIAWDTPSTTVAHEAVRKRRTIAGVWQLVAHFPWVLLPLRNPVWFAFFNHKFARLWAPMLLLGLFAANGHLAAHLRPGTMRSAYAALLLGQLAFYGLAFVGWRYRDGVGRHPVFAAPAMFCALNLTTLCAWGDAFSGKLSAAWDRSDKPN